MSAPAMVPVPVELVPRRTPVSPRAAAARGEAAGKLGALVLQRPAAMARLAAVAGTRLLVVVGPEEHLPWVEGVVYLGADERAPGLLLPTTLQPAVHPQLVERALRRVVPGGGTLALVPRWGLVIPLGLAAPVSPARLAAHLGVVP